MAWSRWGWVAAGAMATAGAAGGAGCGGTPAASAGAAPAASAGAPKRGGAESRLPAGARLMKPEGHLARISCLAFSPDGRQIVSGSNDATLILWDVASGQVVQRLEGHRGFVGGCAFLPDGRGVVSGGWGGEVFVWDTASGERRRLEGLGKVDDVYSLRVRPDGAEVLVGTSAGGVRAWDIASGKTTFESDVLSRARQLSKVWVAGYLDNGRIFAGGADADVVLIWDKQRKTSARIDYKATSGLVLPGDWLALGGQGEIVVVPLDSKPQRVGEASGWVYGLAASPRRELLLSGDNGGHARVWDLARRKILCNLPPAAGLAAAAFDPAGAHSRWLGTTALL